MDIAKLWEEINRYIENLNVKEDGERLWSKYEEVTAILVRLTAIHNDLAYLEVQGRATPEAKKFRTMIVDPTVERFEKVAMYQSRKITARGMEAQLER